MGPAGEVLPHPSAREANRRSQPRTVDAGTAEGSRRYDGGRPPGPWPPAPRRSPRRCRAGAPRCPLGPARAWRHTADRSNAGSGAARSAPTDAPHARPRGPRAAGPIRSPGSSRRPPIRSASTAASSVPTMSTAELRLRQEEPLSRSVERFGEGALARSVRAHADPLCTPRQTAAPTLSHADRGAARPVTKPCSRSAAADRPVVLNQRVAQQSRRRPGGHRSWEVRMPKSPTPARSTAATTTGFRSRPMLTFR